MATILYRRAEEFRSVKFFVYTVGKAGRLRRSQARIQIHGNTAAQARKLPRRSTAAQARKCPAKCCLSG